MHRHGHRMCVSSLTTVLSVCLAVGLVPTATALAGDAEAAIPCDTWNFGFLPQHAEVSRLFWVVSPGDSDLIITEIKSGCTCTTIEPESGAASRDSIPILVTFKTGRYIDRVVKTTRVFVNRADTPERHYRIEAEVYRGNLTLTSYAITPDRLRWYRRDTQPETDTIRLANSSSSPVTVRLDCFPDACATLLHVPEAIAAGSEDRLIIRRHDTLPDAAPPPSITLTFLGADTTTATIPIKVDP